MLSEYAPIAALLTIATLVAILIVFLSRLMGPFKPTHRLLATYESGMRPLGPAVRRIPVKFYRVAILFVLFDIEVIFLLPFAVVVRDLSVYGLAVMGVFFFILTVGFVYEWLVGGLEWE
ncbi:MAG: NADH-quinone oxidoreductase subunit A [Anaerolineae bacterium]|nr:MAG: NADH-quinone oxidoreductase subunit A [Anaerolineae bacterium]MCL4880241.1 NADH-quinone oxidoreductase subunit A [Anaerolineae bacterium]